MTTNPSPPSNCKNAIMTLTMDEHKDNKESQEESQPLLLPSPPVGMVVKLGKRLIESQLTTSTGLEGFNSSSDDDNNDADDEINGHKLMNYSDSSTNAGG